MLPLGHNGARQGASDQTEVSRLRRTVDLTTAPVCVVVNERSHAGGQVYDALDLLRERGADVEVVSPGLLPVVSAADLKGVEGLIAAGGDGTIRCAAKLARRFNLPLAVLPMGTANDFARNLGLPTDLHEAVSSFSRLRPWRIPIGIVNGEPFLNAATVGWSVTAAKARQPESKRRLGVLTYAQSMWSTWRRHPVFSGRITSPRGEISGELLQVVVGKGRFYGGGVRVRDTSAVSYPRFDVIAIPAWSAPQVLKLVPDLLRGHLHEHPGIRHLTTSTLELSTDPPQDISLDGEVVTRTPAKFCVAREGLELLVPAEEPEEHPLLRPASEASLDALRTLLLEQEHTLAVLTRGPLSQEVQDEIQRERRVRLTWAESLERILRRRHTWVTAPSEEHEAPRALAARAARRLGQEEGAERVMHHLSHELALRAAEALQEARAGRPLLARIHLHAREQMRRLEDHAA